MSPTPCSYKQKSSAHRNKAENSLIRLRIWEFGGRFFFWWLRNQYYYRDWFNSPSWTEEQDRLFRYPGNPCSSSLSSPGIYLLASPSLDYEIPMICPISEPSSAGGNCWPKSLMHLSGSGWITHRWRKGRVIKLKYPRQGLCRLTWEQQILLFEHSQVIGGGSVSNSRGIQRRE